MLFSKAFIAGDMLHYGAKSRILMHNHPPLSLSQKTIVSQQQSMLFYKALIDPSKAELLFFSAHKCKMNGRATKERQRSFRNASPDAIFHYV